VGAVVATIADGQGHLEQITLERHGMLTKGEAIPEWAHWGDAVLFVAMTLEKG
jgi:hypothetical protein